MKARVECDRDAELRREAVRRAWEGARNNQEAKAALRAEMERDWQVYRAVMARHEAEAVAYLIDVARRSDRRATWGRPAGPDARVMHLAAANAGFAGAADWAREEVPEGCPPPQWPWAERFWKPKTRRRDLIRAAALIVAEIVRLERAEVDSDG